MADVNTSDVIASLDARLERAYKHLDDLHGEINRAFKTKSDVKVVYNDDSQPGNRRIDIVNTTDTTTIALIASDAIHNLRSALNYVHINVASRYANPPFSPKDRIQFPAPQTPEVYKASVRRSIERLGQDILQVFDTLYSNDGACRTLWRLNQLSNSDKHRTLVGVGVKGHGWRTLKDKATPPISPAGNQRSSEPLKAAFALPFPLKQHTKITGIPDADAGDDVQVTVDIAFNEPGVIAGEPIVETLDDMFNLADAVIRCLVAYLGP